ncbi:MAG TPA: glycosyltransferase [Candidatus Acidoferrales bacterium]|jgi:ceramide glucosyltransferase|nr:glycosyltransferase [Candidatus Acidoferrales bacterium]
MRMIVGDFLLVCCCGSLAYYVLVTVAGLLFARSARRLRPAISGRPSVAILKPLLGWDEALAENLASFVNQTYPAKDLVFGIHSTDDLARRAVETVRLSYPSAMITETVGDEPSSNRKVGKLLRMLRNTPPADILVLTDADARVDHDYLQRVISELTQNNRVGMVTCASKAIAPASSLGARLEASFINTDFTPVAFLSYYLEPTRYALAATIAIRQDTLKEIGGLESVRNCYGDDFALAQRAIAKGYQIRLSSSIVTTTVGKTSLREFWTRQTRWAIVDRRIRPVSQIRLFINGPFWASLLLLLAPFAPRAYVLIALTTIAARLAMATIFSKQVFRLPARAADIALTLVKDLIMQGVWIRSLSGNTVEWRGRKLYLLPNGEMQEMDNR